MKEIARIELKTTDEVKWQLKRASELSGVSLTQFILDVATKKAESLIEQSNCILLDQECWNKLNEVINNPQSPTDQLKSLMNL